MTMTTARLALARFVPAHLQGRCPDPARHRTRCCDRWIVDACPFCGGRHVHGAGVPESDSLAYLGHRAADCGRGGYSLTLAEGA